ncbi:MAG: hypothetical protein AAB019_12360 [Planctomycetota bacterium]
MSQQELLKKVVQTLENTGIPYMITGSIVSSLQGEPRTTHDIDILVVLQKSDIDKLINAFPPPDFYLDRQDLSETIAGGRMFNLINLKEGDKADFWILTDESFDQSRFSRKCTEEFRGLKMQISTPEDTILAKLKWAKLCGGSEKQFTDALRVYEVQFGKLNLDYLEQWVEKLDIQSLWERLKEESKTD